MYIKDVKFVHVPHFEELKPSNVLKISQIEIKKAALYKRLLQFCPEIKENGKIKDRDLFFNILNTLLSKCVEKMVYHAFKSRDNKSEIANEIAVIPEFMGIFTD